MGQQQVKNYSRDARKFQLKNDFLIPAGTEVGVAPFAVRRIETFGEALISLSKDATAELTFDLIEALELGLIEEVK